MKRLLQFLTEKAGASAAEFALVLPGVMILTIGTINVSVMIYAYSALHFATEATARYMSVHQTCSDTSAQTHGSSAYMGPGSSVTFTCTSTNASCNGGSYVVGTVPFNFTTGFTTTAYTLTANSCYPGV